MTRALTPTLSQRERESKPFGRRQANEANA